MFRQERRSGQGEKAGTKGDSRLEWGQDSHSMDKSQRSRLHMIPSIRRSRGFHLYAQSGRRYLDFWQEGGAGILGSRTSSFVRDLKNDLESGTTMRLPSLPMENLKRQLAREYPAHQGVFFPQLAQALHALHELGIAKADIAERKPFLPAQDADIILIRPPLPETLRPAILLLRDQALAQRLEQGPLAAFQARAALRSLHDLACQESTGLVARQRLWKLFDKSGGLRFFERRGPYLLPRDPDSYDTSFAFFLQAGVLISPNIDEASIIPGDFHPGELGFLKEDRS